jgi:hypothetical protein
VPWTGIGEEAARVDAAIAAIDPDRPDHDAVLAAAARAHDVAKACRDDAAPELADCAASVGRALQLITTGEIEPHHAKWQMAAAILAIRQALEHLAANESYSPVALAGAQYELETLFPLPGSLIAPASLVRKLT